MKEKLNRAEVQQSEIFLGRQLPEFRKDAGIPVVPMEQWKEEHMIFKRLVSMEAAEKQREAWDGKVG